jgi:hypothetical protein
MKTNYLFLFFFALLTACHSKKGSSGATVDFIPGTSKETTVSLPGIGDLKVAVPSDAFNKASKITITETESRIPGILLPSKKARLLTENRGCVRSYNSHEKTQI